MAMVGKLPGADGTRTGERPAGRSPRGVAFLVVLAMAGVVGVWGLRTGRFRSRAESPISTVTVDRGDVPLLLVEGGSLESANSTKVKCKVEALVGLVGGATGNARPAGGLGGSGGGSTGGPPASAGSGGAAAGGAAASKGATAPGGAAGGSAPAGSSSPAKAGGSASGGGAPAGGGAAGGGGAGAGAGTAGGAAAGSSNPEVPVITSFSYTVARYVPLRPATSTQAKTAGGAAAAAGAAQGAGGGGGGANRNAAAGAVQEKPGSTRIITILPEGTLVKAGDVVCTLDASAFEDELAAQRIRHAQARSWVEQARAILNLNRITIREYLEGDLPEDRLKIASYIKACRLKRRMAQTQSEWSKEAFRKHYRTRAQARGDELELQRCEIALREAVGMDERLEKFTAPKITKSLQAKGAAITADKLAQESALGLEAVRLHRLEAAVANCTLRAPGDGIVVYASQANMWGRVQQPIAEGTTVREGMPIFDLPDPKHMRVRTRINESKVVSLRTGQAAEIRIDAFPDRPLRGTVAEITPIPSPANGPISDVKIYFALVNIDDGGIANLRPGLSAQVAIDAGTARDVVRVPGHAIRWANDRPFAAVITPAGPSWRPLELGPGNASHVEVRSGLIPGDRVASDPGALDPPPADQAARPAVAGRWAGPDRAGS